MAMPLILLPLVSQRLRPGRLDAGLVPAGSPSTSPSRPIIETLRGLLLGTEIGNNGWIAVAWCVGLTALGYRWSTRCSTATRSNRHEQRGPRPATRPAPGRRTPTPRRRTPPCRRPRRLDRLPGAVRRHRRLELAQHPQPFGQRDHPYGARCRRRRAPPWPSGVQHRPADRELHAASRTEPESSVRSRCRQPVDRPPRRGRAGRRARGRHRRRLDLSAHRSRQGSPPVHRAGLGHPLDGAAPQAEPDLRQSAGEQRSRRARRGRRCRSRPSARLLSPSACRSQCSASSRVAALQAGEDEAPADADGVVLVAERGQRIAARP